MYAYDLINSLNVKQSDRIQKYYSLPSDTCVALKSSLWNTISMDILENVRLVVNCFACPFTKCSYHIIKHFMVVYLCLKSFVSGVLLFSVICRKYLPAEHVIIKE